MFEADYRLVPSHMHEFLRTLSLGVNTRSKFIMCFFSQITSINSITVGLFAGAVQ